MARLKIQILPCVVCFIDGIAIDRQDFTLPRETVLHITYDVRHRLVGFDELGMSDTFKTSVLEDRLAKCSMSASCAPLL